MIGMTASRAGTLIKLLPYEARQREDPHVVKNFGTGSTTAVHIAITGNYIFSILRRLGIYTLWLLSSSADAKTFRFHRIRLMQSTILVVKYLTLPPYLHKMLRRICNHIGNTF